MGKTLAANNRKDAKMARNRRRPTDSEFRQDDCEETVVPSDGDSVAATPVKRTRTASAASSVRKDKSRSKKSSSTASTVSTLSETSPATEDDVSLEEVSESPASSSKSFTKGRPSASAKQEISDLKKRIGEVTMAKSAQVTALEKKLSKSERYLAAMTSDRDEKLADSKAWKAKHAALLVKYKAAVEKLAASRSPDDTKNNGMVIMTKKMAKGEAWRLFKFINSDGQLRKGSTIVLDLLNLAECTFYDNDTEERQQEVQMNRELWLKLYSTDVRGANNENRSYVQSEMKKIALQWMRDGKTLPDPKKFAKIAQRIVEEGEGDSVTEDEEIFDMYVLMLSTCAGSSTYGDKHRRQFAISQCKTRDGKNAVPPGTEAFVMVMYENCYERWLNMHDYKEVQKKKGNIPKYSSKNHEETKQWMGKYSDSCSGNLPYGGWSVEGIKSFNNHSKIFKTLRDENSDTYRAAEDAAVLRFKVAYEEERKRKRRENGYTEETDSAGSGSRRKKKTKANHSEEDGVLAAFEVDD